MPSNAAPLARAARAAVVFAALAVTPVARAAPAADCGTDDLIARKLPAQQRDLVGNAELVTDGAIAPDGAVWDAPAAVRLETPAGSITYDLGRAQPVGAFYLQADANDTYVISGSPDGAPGTFTPLAQVPNVVDQGHGLRGRAIQVPPVSVRYLRIGEGSGDGFFSIAEFAAYCRAPTPFPPTFRPVEAPMASVARPKDERPAATSAPASPIGWFEIAVALAIAGLAALSLRARAAQEPGPAGAAREGEGAALRSPTRLFPLVLLLFVGSGCAALIYEVVWFQLLQLVIGSSAVSIGVLLGTFMGGMCLGSLAASRATSRPRRHPLRVYAVLELGDRRRPAC